LPIFGVAVAGLRHTVQSPRYFLAVFWLPWLLGTIALLVLEVVAQDQLRLGPAPDWVRETVWAPFAAMTYLMLLRWVLDGAAPARAINLDVGRRTWVAAPIIAAWFVANSAASSAPGATLQWLGPDFDVHRWEALVAYIATLLLYFWLVKGAFLACFFGLIVVVARRGRPDPRELWRLLRLQPARLFCISLIAVAAVGGLSHIAAIVQAWLGLDRLEPATMIPWRANIRWALLSELARFPLHFLEFAIEGSILAEAYRRLLLERGGQ